MMKRKKARTFEWFGTCLTDPQKPCKETLNEYQETVISVSQRTQAACIAASRQHVIVAAFRFPQSVAVACEQYLLYFAQLLEDVGEDATVELIREAGASFLSVASHVRPDRKQEIGKLLATYVTLPGSNFSSALPRTRDIAQEQLLAEVEHLRSTLMRVAGVIQMQGQRLSTLEKGLILLPASSSPDGLSPDSARESLIPGILEVVPIEGSGIRVNLPEFLRRLKRVFKR